MAPTLQITVHVASKGTIAFGDGHERFGPGDIVLTDSRRADDTAIGAYDMRIDMVPQDRLPPVLLSPRVHGLLLPAQGCWPPTLKA